MTKVAGSPGEFLLAALNDETGWIPLFDADGDVCVTIRVPSSFVGTIALQTSDQSDATKTRTTTITTYSGAAQPFALPRTLGNWFRMIVTAYTSGSAYVGIGAPLNASGAPVRLSPQMQTNAPVGDSFT